MCTSCGNSSCGGDCKKSCIKVYKPTTFIGGQTGVQGEQGEPGEAGPPGENGADAVIPNDDWVIIENSGAGVSAVTWQGSATDNATPIINVAYKVLNEDTALVKVYAFLDVNITALDNSLNFRFTLDNIAIGASAWFPLVAKKFNTTLGVGTPFAVPIQITPAWDGVTPGIASPTLADYQSKGRAFINNGLVIVQAAGPVMVNDRYQFLIEFEMMARLEAV